MNLRFNHDDEKTHQQNEMYWQNKNEILYSFKMLIETSMATYGFGLFYCNIVPQYGHLSGPRGTAH